MSLVLYGTYYLGYPKRDLNFDNHPYKEPYKKPEVPKLTTPVVAPVSKTLKSFYDLFKSSMTFLRVL